MCVKKFGNACQLEKRITHSKIPLTTGFIKRFSEIARKRCALSIRNTRVVWDVLRPSPAFLVHCTHRFHDFASPRFLCVIYADICVKATSGLHLNIALEIASSRRKVSFREPWYEAHITFGSMLWIDCAVHSTDKTGPTFCPGWVEVPRHRLLLFGAGTGIGWEVKWISSKSARRSDREPKRVQFQRRVSAAPFLASWAGKPHESHNGCVAIG